jgi:hypothetical protein
MTPDPDPELLRALEEHGFTHEATVGVSDFFLRPAGFVTDPPVAIMTCTCGYRWEGSSEAEANAQRSAHLRGSEAVPSGDDDAPT